MRISLIALGLAACAFATPSPAQEQKEEPVGGVFMNISGYLCATPEEAVGFEATRTPKCLRVTDESATLVDVIEFKGSEVGHLVIYNFQDDGSYEYMEVFAPLQELRMEKIPVVQEGTPT